MKVDEVRSILRNWEIEDILKICGQMYNKIPKDKRYEIDDILNTGYPKKQTAKKSGKVSLDELREETDFFYTNAMARNYYTDNTVVDARERKNWRFTAKRLLNAWLKFQPESVEYHESNQQLCRLYEVLALSSDVYIFESEATFRSLSYESPGELFEIVCQRIAQDAKKSELIPELVRIGRLGFYDPEGTPSTIVYILTDIFPTPEELRLMEPECRRLAAIIREDLADRKANPSQKGREWREWCNLDTLKDREEYVQSLERAIQKVR